MKSYTDLEQSKKLAEILPIESADMHYYKNSFGNYIEGLYNSSDLKEGCELKGIEYIPCWSLAALLNIIPKCIGDYNIFRMDINDIDFSIWYDEIGYGVNTELPDITMGFSVDACYEMIIKLHEQKLL